MKRNGNGNFELMIITIEATEAFLYCKKMRYRSHGNIIELMA